LAGNERQKVTIASGLTTALASSTSYCDWNFAILSRNGAAANSFFSCLVLLSTKARPLAEDAWLVRLILSAGSGIPAAEQMSAKPANVE
jgi:hypothetical protein